MTQYDDIRVRPGYFPLKRGGSSECVLLGPRTERLHALLVAVTFTTLHGVTCTSSHCTSAQRRGLSLWSKQFIAAWWRWAEELFKEQQRNNQGHYHTDVLLHRQSSTTMKTDDVALIEMWLCENIRWPEQMLSLSDYTALTHNFTTLPHTPRWK